MPAFSIYGMFHSGKSEQKANRVVGKLQDKSQHRGLALDETDRKNIENALKLYEKNHPRGEVRYIDVEEVNPKTKQPVIKRYYEFCNIQDHLDFMRKYKVDNSKIKTNAKSLDVPIRLTISLPPQLEAWLNKGYPTLFTDEKQTRQFLKWFPRFNLEK